MSEITSRLTTYDDLIRGAVDYLGATVAGDALRDARRCVQAAYRNFSHLANWSYYYAHGRLVTNPVYATGTIEYDHTGGTFERMVTLTDGTWPDWTFLGTLRVNDVDYDVADLMSSTVLRLPLFANPGADIAAGATYTLYRDTYPLPVNFQAADDMYIGAHMGILSFVNPNEWLMQQMHDRGPSVPSIYTITSDPNYFGTMGIRFSPPPLEAYNIDYIYKRRPRQMLIQEYKVGTASVASSDDIVTGTGTNWKDNHLGSIIRFSETPALYPTGVTGDNPFEIQRTVIAVNSPTELQLDRISSQTFTEAKYTISDACDIEDGAMLTGLLREIEKEMRIARRMKPAPGEEERYVAAIMQAKEEDSRSMARRAATGMWGFGGAWRRNLVMGVRGSDIT